MEGEGGGCDITRVPESYVLNFIYKSVNFNISSIVCCTLCKRFLGGLEAIILSLCEEDNVGC